METLKTPVATPNSQEVARTFVAHMGDAKRPREAALVFSQISPREGGNKRTTRLLAHAYLRGEIKKTGFSTFEQQRLEAIHNHLKMEDEKYLAEKNGKFTKMDKARLVIQAKFKPLNGMTNEEKTAMFKEAGYTDDEINKLTPSKTLLSGAIGAGLAGAENAIKGVALAKDDLLPLADNLPPIAKGAIVGGSLLAYMGAYAFLADGNTKLIKQNGISSNPLISSIYFLSDKLYPDKIRDRLSKGIPTALDTLQHVLLFVIPTLAATGEANKVVATTAVATAMNLLYAGVSYATHAIKDKFQRKRAASDK